MLRKSIDAEIQVEGRTVSGYASVFGVVDSDGERVVKGAFASAAGPIPIMWSHGQSVPYGHASVTEDDRGLRFEAEIYPGDEGDRLLQAVRSKAVRGCSFGAYVRQSRKAQDGVRELTDIDLV